MKNLIVIFLLSLMTLSSYGQGIIVHQTNNAKTSYKSNDVQRIEFTTGNVQTTSDTYATKTELQNLNDALDAKKADKSALDAKADKTELAGKADATALEAKADKSELDAKADKTELDAKADKTELDAKADKAALDAKADKTALDAKADKTELAAKADKSELAAKADKTALEAKADKTALEAKADKTELAAKADKSELAAKADKAALDAKADKSALEAKADKSSLEQKADKSALESAVSRISALKALVATLQDKVDKPNVSYSVAVDLGLSVKWASYNVGANSPEEYGDYYAWGETEKKTTYNWSTYKWCQGTETSMTKYCTNSSKGTVDNKKVLDPEDDVAQVKWGGLWRMPTYQELEDLCEKCTWTWDATKNGYTVVGPNGNSIFLPAAGYRNGTSLSQTGAIGSYWSSSLNETYSSFARYVNLSSDGDYRCRATERNLGFSVRPVCP